MTKTELRELIVDMLKEYTGTGSSGGNAGDGNSVKSPRPFGDAKREIENYINKNVYGAEGNHYRKDINTNRNPNQVPNVKL